MLKEKLRSDRRKTRIRKKLNMIKKTTFIGF
jgi:hypothetical protein